MLKISSAILRAEARSALIPFITAGYPRLDITTEVIKVLDEQGVHAIELGIPYSDALADGPVIQESSRIALSQKVYMGQILSMISEVSSKINTPIIVFTYLNPILSRGIEGFVKDLAQSGVDGLVIPDLPLEESSYFVAVCNHYCVELILFVSPSSSEQRIRDTICKAPGCIYLVSSYGVTGERDHIEQAVGELAKRIKVSGKCVMLGFGISSETQVSRIMRLNLDVDAFVMGTAFINKVKSSYNSSSYDELITFCSSLQNAMSSNTN